MKDWKQFRKKIQGGDIPVISKRTNQPDAEPNTVFWQQLESLGQELQTGLRTQLHQNCLDTVATKTDKERWEHLLEGVVLLSAIHLFGLVRSKGGIQPVLTQLVPKSDL